MIYLMTFLASALFGYFSGRSRIKGISLFFLFVAALLPALLAGLRSTCVGTDVELYVVDNYNDAISANSLSYYMSHIYAKEPLYLLVIYFIAKSFGNIQLVLFAFSLITMICVCGGAYRLRKNIPIHYFLLLYFLMFYNDTYNAVRQHIAMAILLLGFKDVVDRKYIRFIVYCFIATLFHSTAFVGVSFVVLHFFLMGNRKKYYNVKQIIVIVATVLVCLIPQMIVTIFINMGILSSRYLAYFAFASVSNNNLLSLILLMEVLFVFGLSRNFMSKNKEYLFYRIVAIMDLLLLQLSRVMFYGNRISMYFTLINLVFFSQMDCVFSKNNNRRIVRVVVASLLLFYWYYIYIRGNVAGTYPYIFA